jgi:hypothetical protein
MITDLLKYYMSEDLGIQIYKKIPYSLLSGLLLYIGFHYQNIIVDYNLLIGISVISLILFIDFTYYFLTVINEPISNLFSDMNFPELMMKFNAIYEKQESLLDDLEHSKLRVGFFLAGLINGIMLFIFMTTIFLLVILNYKIDEILILISPLIIILYLTYDTTKYQIFEEKKIKNNAYLGYNAIELYTTKNNAKNFKHISMGLIYHLVRMFGPLVHIKIPQIGMEDTLLYESNELKEYLEKLFKPIKNNEIEYQIEAGDNINKLLVKDDYLDNYLPYISDLADKSPRENFPYLLNPEFKGSLPGWIVIKIKEQNKIVGHIFIRKYKGVIEKKINRENRRHQNRTYLRNRKHNINNETTYAYFFLIVGERQLVSYLIESLNQRSTKVPEYIINE